MKHEKEIKRWSECPDDTSVWIKEPNEKWWETDIPGWNPDTIYIVNDKYAELRKAYTEGKIIEYRYGISEWKKLSNPSWNSKIESYRIKPDVTYYYQWEKQTPSQYGKEITISTHMDDEVAKGYGYTIESEWRRIDSSKRTWEEE